jgi:hypothetical protein
MAQIVDWNKRKWKLLQNSKHEYNVFQDLLVLTLKNCRIFFDSFNQLSIKQKRTIWSLHKICKHFPFMFFFSLYFTNPIEISNSTRLG